ncbi:SDR family oxidoreductase [Bradyrhizobium sp.]|uniref:SDR family oxidoreductase n=1 Tax=Bradyrhizobium sp. TaxID=376 RepID=UPI000B042F69|nr:SDR family oxidoreductase [Bradyrhizobium sp.]
MGRLNDKSAVITGGTTGIGFEVARHFIAEGARTVVITGVDQGRLEDAAAKLGRNAVAIRADVRSLADLAALADQVQSSTGGSIDILFANAGVGSFAPLEAVDEQFFDSQFDVNVKGVYFTVKAMLPLLGAGSSVILNASSVNGKGLANGSVYFATKAAVRSLARTFAAELAPKGIRVNAVSPGLVPTPFIGKMGLPKEALDGFAQLYMGATPLGRLGTPEEIAPAVVFLASDEARYITAHDLLVDGGWMSV